MRLSRSFRRFFTTSGVSCMANVLGAAGRPNKQARQTKQSKTIQMTWDAMRRKLYSSMYIMHLCGGMQPGSVKGTAKREAGKRNSQQAAWSLTPQKLYSGVETNGVPLWVRCSAYLCSLVTLHAFFKFCGVANSVVVWAGQEDK